MVNINQIINDLVDNTIFITGNEKNAGKTTFLNLILNYLRKMVEPAYMTIGVDGEKIDAVYGNLKPRIIAKKGDWIVTTEFSFNVANFKICEVFPFKTVFGRLVLIKCLNDDFVEIIGPESNEQLKFIINYLLSLSIKTILIDGAVNRITQTNILHHAIIFNVIKISPKNLNTNFDKIKLFNALNNLPIINNLTSNTFLVNGALTSLKAANISTKLYENIVLEDFTKMFLPFNEFLQLQNNFNIYLQNKHKKMFFIFNIKDIKIDLFIKKLAELDLSIEYILNPFQHFHKEAVK
ncbi:MAG TPA: hypothetical protein PK887_03930 [Ignavibacteriales bacterium]|nr:hypothetical protein [Ignavibacteriales bacterium]